MTKYVISDGINHYVQDEMNLHDCILNHDESGTGLYVLKTGDIPLHTVVNDGCDRATMPNVYSHDHVVYFPQDIAGIYLFNKMDNQLIITYGNYYGEKVHANMYGNVPAIILRDELTHIIEYNLSNIVAHCINPDSYFVDLSLDKNISNILGKFNIIRDQIINGTIKTPDCIEKLEPIFGDPDEVLAEIILCFEKYVGLVNSDTQFVTNIRIGPNINIPQIQRISRDEIFKTIPGAVFKNYERISNISKTAKATQIKKYDAYIGSASKRYIDMFSKIHTKKKLFMEHERKNAMLVNDILSDTTNTIVMFSKTITTYDKTHIIRFDGKNGSIILWVPINNDAVTHGYRIHTLFVKQHEDNLCDVNGANCVFCDTAANNAVVPFMSKRYKLGITSLSKCFSIINDKLVPTAVAVENVNGQSYYLPNIADGEERILCFPYSHASTNEPCDNPSHVITAPCGLHTYYYNNPFFIDDQMLWNMMETLNVTLLYAQQKYKKTFVIGPINYDFFNGCCYESVETNVPTIYPTFHLYGNSIGHLHLHVWLCVDGKCMKKTLSLDTSDVYNVNLSKSCAKNIFGNETYAKIFPKVEQRLVQSEPDPSYEGGSFEYAFKKMLGIANNTALMRRKLIFDDPAYDLHNECYLDQKQDFHTYNLALKREVNKIDYTKNANYLPFSRAIPNITYALPSSPFSTILQTNCKEPSNDDFHHKRMVSALIELVTPLNSNIAGFFTRATPMYKEHKVAYIRPPELCVILPIGAKTLLVTNSKYNTCGSTNVTMLIDHLVMSICAYHKLYSITVKENEINIGTLWKQICTSISKTSSTDVDADALTATFGPFVTQSVTNMYVDYQKATQEGGSSVMVDTRSNVLPQQKQYAIPFKYTSASTRIKLINNNRHNALGYLSDMDIKMFIKKHNDIFSHDNTVNIIFDDDDSITVNASDVRVKENTFLHKMQLLRMYHKKM